MQQYVKHQDINRSVRDLAETTFTCVNRDRSLDVYRDPCHVFDRADAIIFLRSFLKKNDIALLSKNNTISFGWAIDLNNVVFFFVSVVKMPTVERARSNKP